MGLYLEVDSKGNMLGSKTKSVRLIADGAIEQTHPRYEPFVVCVVDNGPFEAAGFCYSRQEFMDFMQGLNNRPARWLVAEAACRKNFKESTINEHLEDVAHGAPAEVKIPLTHAERQARNEELRRKGWAVVDLNEERHREQA